MSSDDILAHVEGLGLPRGGVEYVHKAMKAPSRFVGTSGYLAVSSRFASQKVGQVIQSESHTSELPFLHMQELHKDVIAYFDQPPSLTVESIDRRGRRHRHSKTPDYLVIRRSEVILYECKKRCDLNSLLASNPQSWVLDEGEYRYLPLEGPASQLGMGFSVFDTDTIGPIFASNLSLLVNTKRSGVGPLADTLLNKSINLILTRNGMTVLDLANTLGLDTVVPILSSVLHEKLYVAMRWQLLGRADTTTLYASREQLTDVETALSLSAAFDPLRAENFEAPISLSKSALSKGIENLSRISRINANELQPNRSDYRNMAKLRRGLERGVIALVAVSPAYHLRGGREALGKAHQEIIHKRIETSYKRSTRKSVSGLYRDICRDLLQAGLSPIVYETVRQRVLKLDKRSVAEAREGHRAANGVLPPVAIDQSALAASYAFEKAHVDSTPMDEKIWLSTPLGEVLARPILYLLVDEATSYILAYWVCFGSSATSPRFE